MNPKTSKRLFILFLILFYITTGFFREYIFTNINEELRVIYYPTTLSHVSPSMNWLGNFSYSTLYYSKWPLTLIFTSIFALLSAIIIKIIFGEKKLVRISWVTYGVVFITGFLFYYLSSLSHNSETTYEIARFLAGLTETPALLVILCASFLALRHE